MVALPVGHELESCHQRRRTVPDNRAPAGGASGTPGEQVTGSTRRFVCRCDRLLGAQLHGRDPLDGAGEAGTGEAGSRSSGPTGRRLQRLVRSLSCRHRG